MPQTHRCASTSNRTLIETDDANLRAERGASWEGESLSDGDGAEPAGDGFAPESSAAQAGRA
ncbi:MAG: hypothetical protein AAGE52_32800, partial [Myxococcota bacterium]